MDDVTRISALANESRLAVMRWLKQPRKHFPPQPHGDFDELGVRFRGFFDVGCDPAEYLAGLQSKGAA